MGAEALAEAPAPCPTAPEPSSPRSLISLSSLRSPISFDSLNNPNRLISDNAKMSQAKSGFKIELHTTKYYQRVWKFGPEPLDQVAGLRTISERIAE